jgi:hypothetical protein
MLPSINLRPIHIKHHSETPRLITYNVPARSHRGCPCDSRFAQQPSDHVKQ